MCLAGGTEWDKGGGCIVSHISPALEDIQAL